ncbi:hypothetical protein NDU88_006620 [Pleurodeles waltl]|uniref:Secreted protein n=1 Tax=Pleurodeles waltl TaxID=8319 RepID=A0AAV7QPG7_PLEWA|nr:hypothetical protein NDU88_006620 [Pleurodeles waltl]
MYRGCSLLTVVLSRTHSLIVLRSLRKSDVLVRLLCSRSHPCRSSLWHTAGLNTPPAVNDTATAEPGGQLDLSKAGEMVPRGPAVHYTRCSMVNTVAALKQPIVRLIAPSASRAKS